MSPREKVYLLRGFTNVCTRSATLAFRKALASGRDQNGIVAAFTGTMRKCCPAIARTCVRLGGFGE